MLQNYEDYLLNFNENGKRVDSHQDKSNELPQIITIENIIPFTVSSDLPPVENIQSLETEEPEKNTTPPTIEVVKLDTRITRSKRKAKDLEKDFETLKHPERNEKSEKSENESEISENEANLLYYRNSGKKTSGIEEIWTASKSQRKYPNKVIENGKLLFKGEKLMEIVNKFYDLSCEHCNGKKFESLKELFGHQTNVHKIEKSYVTCCQKLLSNMPAIIMHMCRHIQPDAFSCKICGYVVSRPRFLELHKKTHLPDNEKLSCDVCDKKFVWKNALQVHMLSHLQERKQFVCQICEKSYENPGSLSTHKKNAHKGKKSEESLICSYCGKMLKNKNALKEHQLLHREDQEKFQLQCSECGKWLKNKRCLKSHKMLHSNVEHACHLCEYKTKKTILLKRHLITQHSNERNFSCPTCAKTFKLKRALTVHIAQHTNANKKFSCEFCKRDFNNSTNYYTHRKNLHPEELQKLKQKQSEEQRQKRIRAGLEKEDRNECIEAIIDPDLTVLTTLDGKIIDSSFLQQSL